MHLHEEYIKRKKAQVPYVRFDDKMMVFLQNRRESFDYRITKIRWRGFTSRPGHYEMHTYRATKFDGGTFLSPVQPCKEQFYWDELPVVIKEYVNKIKDTHRAMKGDERPLALWSMFLYSFDYEISQAVKAKKFYEMVEISTTRTVSLVVRVEAYKIAMEYLPYRLQEIYLGQFMPVLEAPCEWLENLINA